MFSGAREMNRRSVCLWSFGIVMALAGSMGVARGACNAPVGNTVTCTGGPAASIGFFDNSGTSAVTVKGSPYPTTIDVTTAPAGATVTSVSITISGYSAAGGSTDANIGASQSLGLLLT